VSSVLLWLYMDKQIKWYLKLMLFNFIKIVADHQNWLCLNLWRTISTTYLAMLWGLYSSFLLNLIYWYLFQVVNQLKIFHGIHGFHRMRFCNLIVSLIVAWLNDKSKTLKPNIKIARWNLGTAVMKLNAKARCQI